MVLQFSSLRLGLTALFSLVVAALVLQALGYGIGFALDPESGLREIGYADSTSVEERAVALVGWLGAGMLGSAALLALATILVWRRNPAGAYVAMIVGAVYILSGLGAYRAEWWWDAYFYAGAGALLIVLAAALRWLLSR